MHRFRLPGLAVVLLLTSCAGSDPSPSEAGPAESPMVSHAPSGAVETASESPSDAPSAPASQAAGEPEPAVLADGVISTDAEEYRVSFSPDGATAYFARGTAFFPQSRQATIFESQLVEGEWTEPEIVDFSGEFPDIDPWVSPDGAYILFSSIRPVGDEDRSDAELFRVDREGDGWGEPIHLATLGSPDDELGASVAADGTIVFASDRPGGVGGWDLYTASPAGDGWGEPVPLDELNTAVWEFNPAIDAAGERIVFTSIDRDGGSGLGDLFVSEGTADGWGEARPLRFNTGADEYHPSLSPDGETLYFVRRQGDGDLLEVPWAAAAPG